jgi:hypothetical protein
MHLPLSPLVSVSASSIAALHGALPADLPELGPAGARWRKIDWRPPLLAPSGGGLEQHRVHAGVRRRPGWPSSGRGW